MKRTLKLLSIPVLIVALRIWAAAPPTQAVATFQWMPDPNDMAGLSTNDYCTNITTVIYSTQNVAIPTNLWPAIASVKVSTLLSQGPPGTLWTYQFPIDGKSRFYGFVMTNGNGGTSPFSNLAPGLTGPNAGTLQPLKLQ